MVHCVYYTSVITLDTKIFALCAELLVKGVITIVLEIFDFISLYVCHFFGCFPEWIDF